MKKFTKIFLTAVLLTTGILPMQAQSVSPEKTIKVKIYLLDTFEK